jgi:2-keto-3-deoxy-L-fuconate dehydrogenase
MVQTDPMNDQTPRTSTDGGRLQGKRVLVTCADAFMGPAISELFDAEGADLVTDVDPLTEPDAPARLVADAGPVDAVILNLDLPAYGAKTVDIEDEQWLAGFDAMVHPLMRLVRAAAPAMIERGSGSMVAMTSSSPLRRMSPQTVSYVTARAAQNAFVRSAGHDLARHGVRLNAIAQNFVANDTYYPPEIMENERFVSRLQTEVPARRLGDPAETAELALFLAGDTSTFIFGQILSQDGGWS